MNTLIRSGARLVFGKFFPRVAYPVIRGPLRGARFTLGSVAGEGGGSTIYFNMYETEQTAAFVNVLNKGHVVLDIGANVGYYSILGARKVGSHGKVIAVEPLIRNLFYLYHHTLLNKANNIAIIPAACSDTVSLSTFSLGKNFATGKLADFGQEENSGAKVPFMVPTVTIDTIIQQLGTNPDVIKVDVEGAELSVLKGAQVTLREAKPLVFLSTHSAVLRSNCLEYLREFGYTFEALSLNKNSPSEFLAK